MKMSVGAVLTLVMVVTAGFAEEQKPEPSQPRTVEKPRIPALYKSPALKLKSFCYYFGDDVAACVAAKYDLVVIDPYEMKAADVARIKASGKKMLAYINAGAIENWRKGIWQEGWKVGEPKFLLTEYEGWPGEALVDIANPDWRKILFGWIDAELAKGVDGIFLDNVAEGYRFQEDAHVMFPIDRRITREYVKDIREHVGFDKLIFTNQGIEVLYDDAGTPGTMNFIDGVMQEDLFYSVAQKAMRADAELKYYYNYLDPFLAMGKLVLVADYPYPDHPELVLDIKAKAQAKGYLIYTSDKDMKKIY